MQYPQACYSLQQLDFVAMDTNNCLKKFDFYN